jgi:Holliday junction resolvase RusA-like endonuclease
MYQGEVMTQRLDFDVPGVPIAQGSMRHVGGGRLIPSSPHLAAWRASVSAHAVAAVVRSERHTAHRWPATGAVALTCVFYFERPRNHYRQGKFSHLLRKVAPRHMTVTPDLDKLVRSVGDALVGGGVIVDDKQINVLYAGKQWTTEQAHATISLRTAE